MQAILFTRENARRFWAGKTTTIRGGLPRAGVATNSRVSLRIWSGAAYRSPQAEFGQATVGYVQLIKLTPDSCQLDPPVCTFRRVTAWLTPAERSVLAVKDGFDSFAALIDELSRLNRVPINVFNGYRVGFSEINLKDEALAEVVQ